MDSSQKINFSNFIASIKNSSYNLHRCLRDIWHILKYTGKTYLKDIQRIQDTIYQGYT